MSCSCSLLRIRLRGVAEIYRAGADFSSRPEIRKILWYFHGFSARSLPCGINLPLSATLPLRGWLGRSTLGPRDLLRRSSLSRIFYRPRPLMFRNPILRHKSATRTYSDQTFPCPCVITSAYLPTVLLDVPKFYSSA